MKRYCFVPMIIGILFLFSFPACKHKDQRTGKSENNIDAARNFIRAALDGKFNEARNYLLPDSVNTNYMDVVERAYQNLDPDTKNGYRTASIRINNVNLINDTVTVVIYNNSFKNDQDTLKVIKLKNQWLIDLKYLYQHDQDTLGVKPVYGF